jgi:hypothetical protein
MSTKMFIKLGTFLALFIFGTVSANPDKLQGLSAVDLYESYIVCLLWCYIELSLIADKPGRAVAGLHALAFAKSLAVHRFAIVTATLATFSALMETALLAVLALPALRSLRGLLLSTSITLCMSSIVPRYQMICRIWTPSIASFRRWTRHGGKLMIRVHSMSSLAIWWLEMRCKGCLLLICMNLT